MTNQYTAFTGKWLMGAAIILLAFGTPIFAQQAPGPPPIDRRTNPERARQQEMSQREWQLRNSGTSPEAPPDRKQLEALMAQTEQDFNRILFLHNEMARATSSNQALDYSFVADATTEIRKRASRLQNTLALREPAAQKGDSEKRPEFNDVEMREEVLKLCKLIRSFVTNPVIETPGTVHVDHLETARRDLASIVKLSAQISRNAEKMSKSAK